MLHNITTNNFILVPLNFSRFWSPDPTGHPLLQVLLFRGGTHPGAVPHWDCGYGFYHWLRLVTQKETYSLVAEIPCLHTQTPAYFFHSQQYQFSRFVKPFMYIHHMHIGCICDDWVNDWIYDYMFHFFIRLCPMIYFAHLSCTFVLVWNEWPTSTHKRVQPGTAQPPPPADAPRRTTTTRSSWCAHSLPKTFFLKKDNHFHTWIYEVTNLVYSGSQGKFNFYPRRLFFFSFKVRWRWMWFCCQISQKRSAEFICQMFFWRP